MKASSKIIAKGELPEIRQEEAKQEITMRMASHQAKVAQELAIADRIRKASKVEIEEFYDTQGKGAVGVKGDEESLTLGASGSGRRVVRRIYRFQEARPPESLEAEDDTKDLP